MDRDTVLALVRTLTQAGAGVVCPGEVDDFEDDFAAWTLSAGALGVWGKILRPEPAGARSRHHPGGGDVLPGGDGGLPLAHRLPGTSHLHSQAG